MKQLANTVVKKLVKKKINISFAESCTGGMLSSSITSISGSSRVFALCLISYSDSSKIDLLKIPKRMISKYGAVSQQVCAAMVKNVNKIGKTKMSASITGVAGPKGGTKKKPVGLVYIGIKKGHKISVKKYHFKNKGRLYIQKTSVTKCLKLILSFLK